MKIIITLRNKDTFGKKIDNTKTERKIINFAKKYFDCEGIEVIK